MKRPKRFRKNFRLCKDIRENSQKACFREVVDYTDTQYFFMGKKLTRKVVKIQFDIFEYCLSTKSLTTRTCAEIVADYTDTMSA